MKKIIFIILVIISSIYIYNLEDEEIRVRIISNSNNELDIEYKEEVRIIVEEFLNKNDSNNIDDYIKNNLEILKEQINNEEVKVEYKKINFPLKSYNNKVLENKYVKTLLITINKGKGDNYWGILYPEYLNLNDEKVIIKSWIKEKVIEDGN